MNGSNDTLLNITVLEPSPSHYYSLHVLLHFPSSSYLAKNLQQEDFKRKWKVILFDLENW